MLFLPARRLVVVGVLTLAASACGSPSAAAPKPAAGPTLDPTVSAAAITLMQQKGCGGCHTIPGVPAANGNIGPNLAGVASRSTIAAGAVPNNGSDDLKRWIANPPAVKPGTAMPNLGLTDDEAGKIAAYLETLK